MEAIAKNESIISLIFNEMKKQQARLSMYNRIKNVINRPPKNIHSKFYEMDKCKLFTYRLLAH